MMGMTNRYSRPICDLAEYVDALENGCTCYECLDCCLLGILEKYAKDVSSLELLYDKERKENAELEEDAKRFKKLIFRMFKGAWFGSIDQQEVRSGKKEGSVFGVVQAFRNCLAYYAMFSDPLVSDAEYDEFVLLAEEEEEDNTK